MFIEISGFLFLLIILILVTATSRYGYEIFSELDSEAQLQKIVENPQKFRTGTLLVVMEHVVIVALAVTMFIAFSPYNLLLGVVWVIARGAEGLIQIYRKRDYWGLLAIGEQYSAASGNERDALIDSGLAILKSKNSTFAIAQILFSLGTLAYSIVFAAYVTIVPAIIGWLGITASVIYGLGNSVARVKPESRALWNLGGLLIWIFELLVGGWLLLSPPPIPVPA
ncbi:MAG: DUF4386 domain-containing protein [Candidatus Thorarchaeota archaeon]